MKSIGASGNRSAAESFFSIFQKIPTFFDLSQGAAFGFQILWTQKRTEQFFNKGQQSK
jgi:hypothetical protein